MEKEELIKCLKIHMDIESDCKGCPAEKLPCCYDNVILEVISILEEYQRPQGEWIEEGAEIGAFGIKYTWNKCNQCGWSSNIVIPKNFCPNCGAVMRGDKND